MGRARRCGGRLGWVLTRALKEWFYQLDPADADVVTPDRLGVLAWLRSLLGDDPC